jgi:hypothetical protein
MKTPETKRWPRLTSWPLAWEITLILLIKLAIIIAIKKTFFSNPQAKKMLVPMPQVEQHLLSVAPQTISPDNLKTVDGSLTTNTPQEKHGSN